MSNTELYAPCPCGSAKKYKFCCRDKDRATTHAAPDALPRGSKLTKYGGSTYRVSGNLPDADKALELADNHFREKRESRGPGAQMMEMIQPWLDDAGDDPEEIQSAMDLGMVAWNLASFCKPGDEDKEIAQFADKLTFKEPGAREDFFAVLKSMIERYHMMFPDQKPNSLIRRG